MRMLLYVAALVVLAWPTAAQGQSGNLDRVLAEMHAAMGGADAVAAVRTFRAIGTQQRVTPRGTTDSEYAVAVELPDRYALRVTAVDRGVMSVYRHTGFDGDAVIDWYDIPPDLRTSEGGIARRLRMAQRRSEQATAEQRAEQIL